MEMRLICNHAKDQMTRALKVPYIGVVQATWLNQEKLCDPFAIGYLSTLITAKGEPLTNMACNN